MMRAALLLSVVLFTALAHADERPSSSFMASVAATRSGESAVPRARALETKIHRALELYRTRQLNTRDHGPWEIMHSLIGYGVDTQVRQNGPQGAPVTAIGWLCFNGPSAGQTLFYPRTGGIGAQTGPGLQGHAGQFLAMMAQCRVPSDYPMSVRGRQYTISDLIKYEQDTCEPNTELTFKLIGLSHYLPIDAVWQNEAGQKWSIQRLIREELAQPIRGATCGGTHRLFGLSYAVFRRASNGQPILGEYARARKFVRDYQAYTFRMQNSDGSFSTDWFNGRGNSEDLDRRLQTTGHILEWLAFSLPDSELDDPRMTRAVDYLASIMIDYQQREWSIGPQGHAIHALKMYQDRAFRPMLQAEADSQGDTIETETEPVNVRLPELSSRRSRVAPAPIEVPTGPLLSR